MADIIKEYREKNNVSGPVTTFQMGTDGDMFQSVRGWATAYLSLDVNHLVIDTLKEVKMITLNEINEVSFNKFNGNLWIAIDTTKGLFTGCTVYKNYKAEDNKKIIEFLSSKITNRKPYDKLLKSKNMFFLVDFW